MKELREYPGTPFDIETIEELSGYTVRDIVACYQDYERAIVENEELSAENSRLKSLISEKGQDLWSLENRRADTLMQDNLRLKKQLDVAVDLINQIYDDNSGDVGFIRFLLEKWRGEEGKA